MEFFRGMNNTINQVICFIELSILDAPVSIFFSSLNGIESYH